eukprot:8037667-Ditylum_brightwellii.AAC.1
MAIKRIVHYLISTKDTHPGQKGCYDMIIKLTDDLTLDCFVDVNFTGLWGCEDNQDPNCVKSCTGFFLTLGSTPILWISKLQSKVACSTMEAEYIALAHSIQELLPAQWLLEELASHLDLGRDSMSTIYTMWEDNNGALILVISPMPQMTPRSKYIAIKYHLFHSFISSDDGDCGICVEPIDTALQKGDIFTKPLGEVEFVEKHQMLIG